MRRTLCATAIAAGLATQAHATWSIILIDTRTGEVALGSATCLTNFDLQEGTPVLLPGIGGATAQSFVDQNGFNRVFIRDRLLEGVHPSEIIAMLEDFDTGHAGRQYGIADTLGGTVTFTGSNAGAWAGGVTGRVGDVVYNVQGNVLTGAPVVTETEQIIVSSLEGGLDLPETMMLAMQEARLFGGDGRCSCGNDADACGSPPDGWDDQTGKSAHIAYMLIARAGDGFGCNSVYKTARTPFGLASADFNNDGLADVAAGCRNGDTISVLLNNQLSPDFVTLAPAIQVGTVGDPHGVGAADFDGDGNTDLAYADPGGGRVGVFRGNGDGTFDFVPDLYPASPGSTWIAAADLDGDLAPDIAATSLNDGSLSVLLNDGDGGFRLAQTIPAGVGPSGIVAAEIDGAPGIDLAVADQNGSAALIFTNDGAGTMSLWQTLPGGDRPLGIAAGDFDGDGRTDVATANRDTRDVTVLRQTSAGVFEGASVAAGGQYTAIETADLDGDEFADLIVARDGNGAFLTLRGREGADPTLDAEYPILGAINDMVFVDFNGDGRGDVVTNARSANGVMAVASLDGAPGMFNSGIGCATSDYFMEFNIARQSRDAPDPVAQLQGLFDPWRDELVGVTDAVRTRADIAADRLPVGSVAPVIIEPLDWQLEQVGPGLDVHARHAPGSTGQATIGDVTDNGDGTYSFDVDAGSLPPDARGLDIVEVRVEQDGRTVILMPDIRVRITGSIADWNQDGVVDPTDLDSFLTDWRAADPSTDLNVDGIVNTADLLEFLRVWAGN